MIGDTTKDLATMIAWLDKHIAQYGNDEDLGLIPAGKSHIDSRGTLKAIRASLIDAAQLESGGAPMPLDNPLTDAAIFQMKHAAEKWTAQPHAFFRAIQQEAWLAGGQHQHIVEQDALKSAEQRGVCDDANARIVAMGDALKTAYRQFQFYAEEHRRAGKTEKAETNQRMADMCRDGLATAPAAPTTGWLPIESASKNSEPFWGYLYDTGIRKMLWSPIHNAFVEARDTGQDWDVKWWLPLNALPDAPHD